MALILNRSTLMPAYSDLQISLSTQWDATEQELAHLTQRFFDIHQLSKEEAARHEAELKSMRKRCVRLTEERFLLAAAMNKSK